MADSTQDHDTSMALVRVVLLSNDVALSEEVLDTIGRSTGDVASSSKSRDLSVFQIALPIFDVFCAFAL